MIDIQPLSLARFVRAVAVLALPADDQLAFLESIGQSSNLDELALEFDDGRLLMAQFVELGWLDRETASTAGILNELLDDMSGEINEGLWTPTALQDSAEWIRVRLLARDVLFGIS